MFTFLVVTAADTESAPIFESLGGRAISRRMGTVPWNGTAKQLYRRVFPYIAGIILIASLNEDCLLTGI